jgi:hypothetical protein
MGTVLNQLPSNLTNSLSPQTVAVLTGKVWFPTAIANAFMSSLGVALYFNVALALVAAAASVLRGKKYVYGMEAEKLEIAVPIKTSRTADAADRPPNAHRPAPNEVRLIEREEPKERLRRTQSEA